MLRALPSWRGTARNPNPNPKPKPNPDPNPKPNPHPHQAVGSQSGKTSKPVVIADCGQLS